MTDAEMLARLPLIAATAGQVDRYLRAWVGRIRERHISYAEIGKALGVSRQAAWERFSRVVDDTKNDTNDQTTSCLTDLTGRAASACRDLVEQQDQLPQCAVDAAGCGPRAAGPRRPAAPTRARAGSRPGP